LQHFLYEMQPLLNSLLTVGIVWFVIAFFSFGEFGCANLVAGLALLMIFGIVIQNVFTLISPYLIWLALVPLVPAGLWLGRFLENRLNPVPKDNDPNQIPPF
jgi:hypothetical protein